MGYYEPHEYYSYNFDNSQLAQLESVSIAIVMLVMLALFVRGVFALAKYIIKGIGLYTLAARQGISAPGLAFVPFARVYLQGQIGGDIRLKQKTIRKPGIWLLGVSVIYGILLFTVYISSVVAGTWSVVADVQEYSYYYTHNIDGIKILAQILLPLLLVGIVGILHRIVQGVLLNLVNVQIYRKVTTENMAIVHAVLGYLIPMYEAVCLLVMRNRPFHPGMEPACPGGPGMPPYPDDSERFSEEAKSDPRPEDPRMWREESFPPRDVQLPQEVFQPPYSSEPEAPPVKPED